MADFHGNSDNKISMTTKCFLSRKKFQVFKSSLFGIRSQNQKCIKESPLNHAHSWGSWDFCNRREADNWPVFPSYCSPHSKLPNLLFVLRHAIIENRTASDAIFYAWFPQRKLDLMVLHPWNVNFQRAKVILKYRFF